MYMQTKMYFCRKGIILLCDFVNQVNVSSAHSEKYSDKV